MKPAHDYFSTPEQIPAEVATILATFDESADPYKELQRLNKKLLKIQWTFDFYLDAEPFNLMPKADFDRLIFNDDESKFYIN